MTDVGALERIGRDIASARFAVVFTGAGISTGSGLPDYRGPDGLWKNRRFEELANIETFKTSPVEFWEFYAHRLEMLADAEPNAAHRAVEGMYQADLIGAVITQNVDGLHRREVFGTDLAELHGTLERGVCLDCGKDYHRPQTEERIARSEDGVPRCDCGYPIKPGVVLFGEVLPEEQLVRAQTCTSAADYMLCLGTSLSVFPAALLPATVLENGGKLAIINKGRTEYDDEPGVIKVEASLAEAMPIVAADAERGRGS
jgi:NAD-dependent deacetylase